MLDTIRQKIEDSVDALNDIDQSNVRVRIPVEINANLGNPFLCRRLHIVDISYRCNTAFDDPGNGLFHIQWARTVVVRQRRDDGNLNIGKKVNRELLEGHVAENEYRDGEQEC